MSVERSAPGGAVFLSYASQDADAARSICAALRAARVEVWFDQNELVGGDAWDAKIRKQIRECALFVPIISASTQARAEGYFRLEWRLADQRTHLMGKTKAFLLPVCVDDTRDIDADVPDSFLSVQWMRLGGGERADEFCARVKTLLDSREPNPAAAIGSSPPNPGRASHAPASAGPRIAKASRWVVPACTAGIAFIAVALWWPRDSGRFTVAASPSATSSAGTAAAADAAGMVSAPLSPARKLVEKARVLYEPWDLATKDDLIMADQFLKRAVELDPTDGEVWAAQTLVSCALVGMNITPERVADMRVEAERAIKLAPHSDTARFAWAYAVRLEDKKGAWEQVEPILRDVVIRNPGNKMMLRGLGFPLAARPDTRDEGLAVLRRAAALPGGDAVAEFNIGQNRMVHGGRSKLKEALDAFNRSLKLAPSAHRTHSNKIELLLRHGGDLTAARQALHDVPEIALREDRLAAVAVRVLLATGEPDAALRVLDSTYPYLNSIVFSGPAAYLKGVVHRQAGRESAATTEWNVALKEIQTRLDATPTALRELLLKAATLAHLGRHVEATRVLQLYEQLSPPNARPDLRLLIVKTHLGRIPEVVAGLEEALIASRPFTVLVASADFILFDPELAPLRSHPGYAALADKARAVYADVN